jgi:hypothetical protein
MKQGRTRKAVRAQPIAGLPDTRLMADDGQVMTLEMAVDDWLTVADHPREFATERRAQVMHWETARHASGVRLEHMAHVAAALLGDQFYKLSGHTRAYLWARNELPRPATIRATVYRVKDRAELNTLYAIYNPVAAPVLVADRVRGAYREAGLQLRSAPLADGFIADALHIALRGELRPIYPELSRPLDLYKAVAVFRDELQQLDALRPPAKRFSNGIIAAALIMLALEPSSIEFFQRVARGKGERRGGRMDPVAAVLELIDRFSDARTGRLAIKAAEPVELCARTVRAARAWQHHHRGEPVPGQYYWFKTTVRAIDLAPLIAKLKTQKGIAEDLDL